MKSFYHVFRNKRYKVCFVKKIDDEGNWGECDPPEKKGKKIKIKNNLGDKNTLTTALDEAIHACTFDLDNEAVNEMSQSISNFLWKLGYKRIP
tara:strand:- start:2697 stop:2975 length:279 start_codon:yes stop_codon:yes gene_type:complete